MINPNQGKIIKWYANQQGFIYDADITDPDTHEVKNEQRALKYTADGFAAADKASSSTKFGHITWTDFDKELISWAGSHRYTPPDAAGNVYRRGARLIDPNLYHTLVDRIIAGAAYIKDTTVTPAVVRLVVFSWVINTHTLYCSFFENGELKREVTIVNNNADRHTLIQHVVINPTGTEASCIFKNSYPLWQHPIITTLTTWAIDLEAHTITVSSELAQDTSAAMNPVTATNSTTPVTLSGYLASAAAFDIHDTYQRVMPTKTLTAAVDYKESSLVKYEVSVHAVFDSETIGRSVGDVLESIVLPVFLANNPLPVLPQISAIDAFNAGHGYPISYSGTGETLHTSESFEVRSTSTYTRNYEATVTHGSTTLSKVSKKSSTVSVGTVHTYTIHRGAEKWEYVYADGYTGVGSQWYWSAGMNDTTTVEPDTTTVTEDVWEFSWVVNIDLRYDYFHYHKVESSGAEGEYLYHIKDDITVGSYTESTAETLTNVNLRDYMFKDVSIGNVTIGSAPVYSVFTDSGYFSYSLSASGLALLDIYKNMMLSYKTIATITEQTIVMPHNLELTFSNTKVLKRDNQGNNHDASTITNLKGLI